MDLLLQSEGSLPLPHQRRGLIQHLTTSTHHTKIEDRSVQRTINGMLRWCV